MISRDMSDHSGLQLRSRLQFSQSSSGPTPARLLSNAFGQCSLLSQPSQRDTPVAVSFGGEHSMEACSSMSSQLPSCSQEVLCTPDFVTPVDQQFEISSDPECKGNKQLRSPAALSPSRAKRAKVHTGQTYMPEVQPVPQRIRSPPCYRNVFLHGPEESRQERNPVVLTCCRRGYSPTSIYRLEFKELGLLGQGNFSKVFRVLHRLTGQEYAVKRSCRPLLGDSEKRQWLQELQALAAVGDHPNIVRYHYCWSEPANVTCPDSGEHMYVLLELCDVSLGSRAAVRRRPGEEAELVAVLKDMAAALQHLHARGVAHMDVKPDNIFTSSSGAHKLGDFGLATPCRASPNTCLEEGDCRYLPREIMNGDYSHLEKADAFALGATLYELATGAPLPKGGSTYQDIRGGKLFLMPTFTEPFKRVVRALMSPDPADRPSPEKILALPLITRQGLKAAQSSAGLKLQPTCTQTAKTPSSQPSSAKQPLSFSHPHQTAFSRIT